jgi:alkylation response protein AidB-like acyl-CoA dehydrogenase
VTTIIDQNLPVANSADDVVELARGLQPLLEAHGPSHDLHGRLDEEVVDALHDARLFGLFVPASLGGWELPPRSAIEAIEILAYSDPSTAWVTMAAAMTTGCAGAYLPDSAVERMFAGDRLPVTAGVGGRPGRAVPVDGGHSVSGTWNFGSGLLHAQYIHTMGMVEGGGEARIYLVPKEKAQFDLGSWDVMGLRGTGSVDYTLDEVVVPVDFSYVSSSTSSTRGGPLYRLGTLQMALISHGGWAIGVGRRLLDELAESRSARPLPPADQEVFLSEFAGAEGTLRSARAFLLDAWDGAWATLSSGDELTRRQKTEIRLATHTATWSAARISEYVYRSAGTAALRAGRLQQFYRDMHAGTQHVTSGPGVLRECGRELAGMAEGAEWMNLALIGPST